MDDGGKGPFKGSPDRRKMRGTYKARGLSVAGEYCGMLGKKGVRGEKVVEKKEQGRKDGNLRTSQPFRDMLRKGKERGEKKKFPGVYDGEKGPAMAIQKGSFREKLREKLGGAGGTG